MVYSIILLLSRKPSVTWAEFKHYWETQHMPLLKQLVGHDFPLSHTRHYLELNEEGRPNVEIGSPEGIDYDGLAVLTFWNKDHCARFMKKLQDGEKHDIHARSLDQFVDVGRLRGFTVGQTSSTGRDGGAVGWRFVGSV
ncbi:hypothetical protein DM02DRAFT_610158 [Periconia macrospinosa]|uniref:EthD domain-containing protein n=1 Tax=Periconia macrospinosa TaxID=97972 RepID=A0A2V1E6S7_9PLEO|nr:hypothetical protein DM02DRAFT_610158 [Periconia macrospinosa]